MPLTNRICAWCGQRELRPNTLEEWNQWLDRPKGCCAPDGDGHLWRERYPHETETAEQDATYLCGVNYIADDADWRDERATRESERPL